MRKIGLLFCLLMGVYGTAFSQIYAGSGNWEIKGVGTNTTTTLATNYTDGSLQLPSQKLVFQAKSSAFRELSSPAKMSILSDVFLYPMNRLLKIELDANDFHTGFNAPFALTNYTIPCKIHWANQVLSTTAIVHINFDGNEQITCSVSILSVDIQTLGLFIGTHTTDFSNITSFTLDNWVLHKLN